MQRTFGLLADYLELALATDETDVTVEYAPVTDSQGAVTGFRVGDLDAVWFGGLTGVQARLEVEGANAIAQRDIDESFTSVFIASTASGLEPVADVAGLAALEGHSITFGSESSTSGRLMPQSFLTVSPAVYMPPEDIVITRDGAERRSRGRSSEVRRKGPTTWLATVASVPSGASRRTSEKSTVVV